MPEASTAGFQMRVRKVLREMGVPTWVGKSRSSLPMPLASMCAAMASSQVWRTPKVRVSLSFG